MRVAFCLFRYFPFGGLERDFFQTASYFAQQGHEVHVYTMSWTGEKPSGWHIHEISVRGWSNHTRATRFSKIIQPMLRSEQFDVVIGFNKMPGLDFYYAADVCYAHIRYEKRGRWMHLFPRDRAWLALEKSIFSREQSTIIMLLSSIQGRLYFHHYKTPEERMILLPPSIPRSRFPTSDRITLRQHARAQFHLNSDALVLLMVAVSLKTKGFDRVLKACSALPVDMKKCVSIWIVGGQDADRMRHALPKDIHVEFFGMQNDILPYIHAADVLVHPARVENTGLVLLEAMVNGLPVLTTANCGYAHYIEEAEAGEVCLDPFDQNEWNHRFCAILSDDFKREQYSKNGFCYGEKAGWSELAPTLYHFILKRRAT